MNTEPASMEPANVDPGASGTGEAGTAARFSQALANAPLPAWRKAYLANLIASGKRFAEAGNARGAGYCFAKVEEALQSLPPAPAAPAAENPVRPRPADRIRSRWRRDKIEHAEKVLEAHGGRLSGLEQRAYRERLAKLRQEAEQPSQAGKADAGLLDLRRRLYQRVLKSQKISLLRMRAPVRPPLPARVSATPAAWQPVTGPYNDRSNIEELLAVIGAADPAWVEEFLELYGGLAGLNVLLEAATAGK
jgi:hypothetical protein